MNSSVLQENVLKALTRTSRTVPVKPQLPILSHVLLQTEDGRLRVTTTNLETTETVWIGAKTTSAGGICVPSRLLTDLVSSLSQDTVKLSVAEGVLHISCGSVTATIPGLAASEFPQTPAAEKKKESVFEKDRFIDVINDVLFAAATDAGRPLLTGVKITSEDKTMTIVATDGYRLSVRNIELSAKNPLSVVVPGRALAEVVKVGQEEKEEKAIKLLQSDDGQLIFVVGETEVSTRVIDGDYPPYQKIIPTMHTTKAIFDRQALLHAVKSAAIFARDNANIVRLHISGNSAVVSANTPQVGENKIEIDASVDGEGGDMAYNSRFLLDYLGHVSSDEVVFEMTGSLNPGVFKLKDNESYLHIIMPVRVQG